MNIPFFFINLELSQRNDLLEKFPRVPLKLGCFASILYHSLLVMK